MTTKIKVIIFLAMFNILIFKWIIPIWCIIQIILGVGEPNFYVTFFNNFLYIVLSLILEVINIPSRFLSTSDKKWMSDEVERIKNKDKQF